MPALLPPPATVRCSDRLGRVAGGIPGRDSIDPPGPLCRCQCRRWCYRPPPLVTGLAFILIPRCRPIAAGVDTKGVPYPPPGQSGCLAPVGRAACCCPFCCLPAAAAGATPALAQSTKTFQPCATLQTNRRLLPSSGRIPAPSSPRGLQIARRHRSVFCKLLLPAASRPFAPHGCPWQCPPFRHCAACSGLYLVSCSGSWSYVQNAVATTSSLPLRLFLPAGLRPAPTWVRPPRAQSWALRPPAPASRLRPAVTAPRCCGGLLCWPVSSALGDATACDTAACCLGAGGIMHH